MAFSQREQQIILNIKKNGGNAQDAIDAVNNFRTGKKLTVPRYAEKSEVDAPSYAERVGEQITQGAGRVGQAVVGGADIIETTDPGTYERARGAVFTGAEAASGALQVAAAPVTAAVEPIISGTIEGASNMPWLQKLTMNPIVSKALDVVLGGVDKVKEWAVTNPQEAKILADVAEMATVGKGAPVAKQAAVKSGEAVARGMTRVGEVAGTTVDAVTAGVKDMNIPILGAVKTSEVLERDALKAAAELLQSGSKKSARGRAAEFNNADIQAMRVIRDTLQPLKSQQELAQFFDDAISVYQKNRSDILRPLLKDEVTDAYQSPLKAEIRSLMQANEMNTASAYSKLLSQEKELFSKYAKQAPGGKPAVEYLANRIAEINKKVETLFNEVGGRENLPPEQKIQVQAYDKLREGLKRELDAIGGEQYAELGQVVSGLIDARTFARIQRDRAKNALTDAPWETMTAKERAIFIKGLFPTLKDFGVNGLIKLDTKADVLDAIVEQKVRQIRQFGGQALEATQ